MTRAQQLMHSKLQQQQQQQQDDTEDSITDSTPSARRQFNLVQFTINIY